MRALRFMSMVILASLTLPLVTVAADLFPDVPADYPFKANIETLVGAGVVKGNPDGKFYPERKVNRAEFLKMVYTAIGKIPKPGASGCFPDVAAGSWYESFVCDAASRENNFVSGYADGKFRPEAFVTRAQALKMIYEVFGLPTPDISEDDRSIVKFADVSIAAWYTKYLSAAFVNGMLPIAGQDGPRFYPDRELTRGEAAAYIANAMNVQGKMMEQASAGSSARSSRGRSSSAASDAFISKSVTFPFTDAGVFVAKRTVSYLFSLGAARTVVAVKGVITNIDSAGMICRLYLMGQDGFTTEYYLSHVEKTSCNITAALKPGDYQLQIQPTVADTHYTIATSATPGDGNDGFIDAVELKRNAAQSGQLEPNDIQDWFRFTVPSKQNGKIEFTGAGQTSCVIYVPAEVDQYGFAGPECNLTYEYQPGTYVVGVGRSSGLPEQRRTYTVIWR